MIRARMEELRRERDQGLRSRPCPLARKRVTGQSRDAPAGPSELREDFAPPRQYPIPPTGPLCVGDREARADGQRGELIDRVAAGAPVRKLLFVEPLGHAWIPFAGLRADHRAGMSRPQSTRIVQLKRRPTSNVDSMMVLRAKRDGTGSKYVFPRRFAGWATNRRIV